MSLAADIRIVSEAAVMTCGYARIGVSPDAGLSYFLPRLVGIGRATEMILTARDIGAEEAVASGLAAAKFPAADFAESAIAYASKIAAGPTVGLIMSKRLLGQTFLNPLEVQLRAECAAIKQCFATEDSAEAIQAFRDKRKPAYKGK